jgi:hypothetical protein
VGVALDHPRPERLEGDGTFRHRRYGAGSRGSTV